MPKQTGWVIAATEGATVDGRTITPSWIKDMAEQYSVEEYAAMVWPEHFRSSWGPFEGNNWGIVDEVKAAKYKGKLRLYVKLTANEFLLEANAKGQKLFMSIEPNIDYKATGRCYLQGLAVTDSPASSGTSLLKFSAGNQEKEHEYSQLEPLLATDFFSVNDNPERNLISALMDVIKSFTTSNHSNTPETPEPIEEDEMTKEQHEALMGQFTSVTEKLEAFSTKQAEFETKLATFSQKPKGEEKPEEEIIDDAATKQFNALNDTLTSLSAKFEDMNTKFTKLSGEVGGQEPDPVGGDTVNLV